MGFSQMIEFAVLAAVPAILLSSSQWLRSSRGLWESLPANFKINRTISNTLYKLYYLQFLSKYTYETTLELKDCKGWTIWSSRGGGVEDLRKTSSHKAFTVKKIMQHEWL